MMGNIRTFYLTQLFVKQMPILGGGGITGFMAGCVAGMVSQCHSRGEEFRKKWNESYGAKDAKGTINPALVTIKFGEKEKCFQKEYKKEG